MADRYDVDRYKEFDRDIDRRENDRTRYDRDRDWERSRGSQEFNRGNQDYNRGSSSSGSGYYGQGQYNQRDEGLSRNWNQGDRSYGEYNRGFQNESRGQYDRDFERFNRSQDFGRNQYDYDRDRYSNQGNYDRSGLPSNYTAEQRYYSNQGNYNPRDFEYQGRRGNWNEGRNFNESRNWNEGRYDRRREFSGERGTGFGGYPTYGAGGGLGTYGGYDTSGIDSWGGGIGSYAERGQHSGRGPKNFQRSDERITEEVCHRLTQDPNIDATDINIHVDKGVVKLTGNVDDRRAKRAAEDVAHEVWGVKDVHNELRVQQNTGSTNTGNTGTQNQSSSSSNTAANQPVGAGTGKTK